MRQSDDLRAAYVNILNDYNYFNSVTLTVMSVELVRYLRKKIFKLYSKTCVKRPVKNRQNKDLYYKW